MNNQTIGRILRPTLLILIVAAVVSRKSSCGSREVPLCMHTVVTVGKGAAQVTVRVNGSPASIDLAFVGDEHVLGIQELSFLTPAKGRIRSSKVTESVTPGSPQKRTWHRLQEAPSEFTVEFLVDPPSSTDFFGNAHRLGLAGPTTVLNGSHLLLIARPSQFQHLTFQIAGGAPVGLPSEWGMTQPEETVEFIERCIAVGPTLATTREGWSLYLDPRYDKAQRTGFEEGFAALFDEVKKFLPSWTKDRFHLVLAPRHRDNVQVIEMGDRGLVFLDCDRPYPALWYEALRELAYRRHKGEWIALGLSALIGDAVGRKLDPASDGILAQMGHIYTNHQPRFDEEVLSPFRPGRSSRRFALETRTMKSALMLSMADEALKQSGVADGIWAAGKLWADKWDPFDALAKAGGLAFSGRLRGWCDRRSFAYGVFPPFEARRKREAQESARRTLTVLYAGSGAGHIETCGCNVKDAGGLARRSYLINQARRAGKDPFIVDLGNSLTLRKPRMLDEADTAEQSLFLELLDQMKTDVLIPGTTEVVRGRSYLDGVLRGRTFARANCGVDPPGTVPDLCFIRKGDLKIAVIGWSEHSMAELTGRNFGDAPDPCFLRPSLDRLAAALDKVGDADLTVVGGWFSGEMLGKILASYSDRIDLILSDNPMARLGLPLEQRTSIGGFVGHPLVLFHVMADQGVSSADLSIAGPHRIVGFEFDVVKLDKEVADDPELRERISRFFRESAERELRSSASIRPLMTSDTAFEGKFVGTDACAQCHENQVRQYHGTKHANAFRTLIQLGRQYTIRCTPCHVVGFASPGGWQPANPSFELRNVGCESCHGSGQEHLAKPVKGNIRRTPLKETCESCHDPKHSPGFLPEFDRRWEAVKH